MTGSRTHHRRHVFFVAVIFLCTGLDGWAQDRADDRATEQLLPEVVTFNAHIRPIMSNTCFVCHGPDDADNDSGFRLDSYEAATSQLPSDESLVGIAPGDPMASEIYRRIIGEGEGEAMPPSDFRHQLSDYDRELFRKWIEQGAEYQEHWAYAPIERPLVPELNTHAKLVKNPVDNFILAKLEQHGIEPTEVGDKATLLRRVSLDLIGLPPTPAELEAFLADDSEEAYERVVERLLQSEHFGERMAASWLDLVRFADTVGFHGDQNQRVFPYRDYVIQSFNENKPFDEFTREQIAGDLLPNPSEEQLVATGVLRLNMVTREGGAQPGEYLAKYRADRVRTLGTAWLGSTLGCCECHNHKYDPFTAKDFYSFGSFFDGLRQWGVYADYGYTPNPELKGFNNDYPFPPELRVESESARREVDMLERERDHLLLAQLGNKLQESKEFSGWRSEVKSLAEKFPDGWVPARVTTASASHTSESTILDDASVLLTGQGNPKESITVSCQVAEPVLVNSIRVEVLPDDRNQGFVGRAADGHFTLELTASVKKHAAGDSDAGDSDAAASQDAVSKDADSNDPVQPLSIAWTQVDRLNPTSYRGGDFSGVLSGKWRSGPSPWQLPSDESKLTHTAVYHLASPIRLLPDDELLVELKSGDVGRVRFSVTPIGQATPGRDALSPRLLQALDCPVSRWNTEQNALMVSAFHRSTTPFDDQHAINKSYRDKLLDLHAGMAMTLIAQEMPEEQIAVGRVLPRGNWQDESGEPAPPAFPTFLPSTPVDDSRRLTRLDLANWLVSEDNPLTPRHFVNRTWKHFFGMGLSAKLDDLGNQGEWPSHPLLLDWLAAEFVDSGWDMKHIIRTTVTSRTYQQAAAARSDLREVDPYNRLLAQQSPRRLEAEIIRDNALAISGLLVKDYIGGPSVFPYQPDGHYDNLQFPNRSYTASSDFRQYRRGLYMHWQRTFLHPMLVNFDAPSRDECSADRPLSNSPQQALTLLNDPSYVEASHAMAKDLLQEMPAESFEQLLNAAFLRALARSASEREHEALSGLFQGQLDYFSNNQDEAAKFLDVGNRKNGDHEETARLAAFSQVCRVILNLHETITRY